MNKDHPTNKEKQPILKTWQQFEKRILSFYRENYEYAKNEWNQKGVKGDWQKLRDEITAIIRAYYQGAENEIEKRVRGKHITRVRLNSSIPAEFFFGDEKSKKQELAEAAEITSETVEQKLQEMRRAREGEPPQNEAVKKKSIKKSALVPAEARVTTDRVFNMLYDDPERGLKIVGDFNYKVKWVHDCFTHILKKEYVDKAPRLKEAIFKPEDKDLIVARINEFRSYVPKLVTFQGNSDR